MPGAPRPPDILAWAVAHGAPPTTVVAACAQAILRFHGADLASPLRLADALDCRVVAPPGAADLTPRDLGGLYEKLMSRSARRRGGVHYTPGWLAAGLVGLAVGRRPPGAILDPSVGGGVFLLAAADALTDREVSAEDSLRRLWGIDIDPTAVAVTEAAMAAWGARHGVEVGQHENVVVGDALLDPWPCGSVEVVVGNPPFLSQLAVDTRRDPRYTDRIAQVIGLRPGAYTDTAALFLARAVVEVDHGGRVCLVLPTSVAAARDAAPIRRFVGQRSVIEKVWRDDGSAFAAGAVTFAPLVVVGGAPVASTQLFDGRTFDAPSASATDEVAGEAGWAHHLGSGRGEMAVAPLADRLDSLARVTAGFRDEYYAIAGAVIEAAGDPAGAPRVITSGSIEVGRHMWGSRVTTIAKHKWTKPVAPLDEIADENPRVGEWSTARLVPKVLVATQTRLIEAVIDPDGDLLPLTPVVSVEPHDSADLARVAAVLLAPAVSRHVVQQRQGTGMSATAVRISARVIADIPLPEADCEAWRRAAIMIENAADKAHLDAQVVRSVAVEMQVAYGAGAEVFDWWWERAKLELV